MRTFHERLVIHLAARLVATSLPVRALALAGFTSNFLGDLRCGGEHNGHANFRAFPRSFLTLMRCMTGEGWNELMHALAMDAKGFSQLSMPCVPWKLQTSHLETSNFETSHFTL